MRSLRKIKQFGISAAVLALLLPVASCGGNGGGEQVSEDPLSPDLPAIKLISPATTGAGEVPTFEWEAVDGADSYRLVVVDGSGEVLWAWTGSDTKVNLGGLPFERPEGVGGPILTAGSSWSVIARDAGGNIVATSAIRSVSP